MAHARQANRAFPQVAISPIVAAVAAILVAGTLTFSALDLGLPRPAVEAPQVNPALVEAGRQWELQRKAESGYVDPLIRSAREWEEQRRQQSAFD